MKHSSARSEAHGTSCKESRLQLAFGSQEGPPLLLELFVRHRHNGPRTLLRGRPVRPRAGELCLVADPGEGRRPGEVQLGAGPDWAE